MESIDIKGYSDDFFVPTVKFDAETGECLLEGESYLEETVKFYAPIVEWLETYIQEVKKKIKFTFKLTYFNTSSSKRIIEILNVLKDYEEGGGEIDVYWVFEEEDSDIIEEVEDFMIISRIKINFLFEDE